MFEKRSGGRLLAFAVSTVAVQLVVFKLLYPHASYFYTDSFNYLMAAAANQDVSVWPIGYSKFLRVFNTFIHAETGLVCFQYLFLQGCGLYFIYTLGLLFQPRRWVLWILYMLILINPLSLYLANSISSDAIFTGLSFCWIAVLLKMIHSPSRRLIWVHAGLLALIFTFRNNAVYYPLVSVAAILSASYRIREKGIAILLPLLLMGGFVGYTVHAARQVAGVGIFSAFGGWQLANNALYAYSHVSSSERMPAPADLHEIDRMSRACMDQVKLPKALDDNRYPGIWYLWDSASPLVQYKMRQERGDPAHNALRSWMAQGPLFGNYGFWLVRTYPGAYLRHFAGPNAIRYALPDLEFMGLYNSNMDTIQPVAQHFFGSTSNRVDRRVSNNFQNLLLRPYQVLHLLVNLFFVLILVLYWIGGNFRRMPPLHRRMLLVLAVYWLSNLVFIILTAPVVLRYEVAPMWFCLGISLLMADRLSGAEAPGGVATWRRMEVIADISAFALCFLFVYSATAKLFKLDVFFFQLEGHRWLKPVAKGVGWAVPLTELVIAGLLLSGRLRAKGLLAALALLSVFTVYLVSMLGSGQHLPCSCGGVIASLSWSQHVWFNVGFILLAGGGLYIHHHKKQVYET